MGNPREPVARLADALGLDRRRADDEAAAARKGRAGGELFANLLIGEIRARRVSRFFGSSLLNPFFSFLRMHHLCSDYGIYYVG